MYDSAVSEVVTYDAVLEKRVHVILLEKRELVGDIPQLSSNCVGTWKEGLGKTAGFPCVGVYSVVWCGVCSVVGRV